MIYDLYVEPWIGAVRDGLVNEGSVLVDEPVAGVRRVRLNRGARRNAVDRALLDGLLGAFESPPPLVVLASTDPAAFCSGMDIDVADHERTALSDALYGLYEQMIGADTVFVAAVSGPAVGAGAQLAIASDLRVLHPEAWLRFPGVGHGLAVGAWGLPSLIGRGRALRVCATMQRISAASAEAWGLADAVAADVEPAALQLAAGLAEQQPAALARVKRVTVGATGIRAALQQEREHNRRAWRGSIEGLARERVEQRKDAP